MRRLAILLPAALLIGILPRPLQADPTIWFEDARHSPAFSDDSVRSAAAYVRHRLLAPADAAPADLPLMPAAVRDDFFPRILFISAGDGVRTARVAAGTARGILKTADDAIAQLRLAAKTDFKPRWLKIDVPDTILVQEQLDLTRRLEFERSLFGLAFPRAMRIALIPEDLIAGNVINHEQGFFPEQLTAYLEARGVKEAKANSWLVGLKLEAVTVFRFSTRSFYVDASEIVPLYRGHRQFPRLTRDELKAAARAAADYLARSVGNSGQFAYLYQPDHNKVLDEYMMLEHFGAVLAMVEAYELFKDDDLLAAAKRAVDFADNAIGHWTQDGARLPVVVERNQVRLGTQALAAAALARLAAVTGDKKIAERASAFAATILSAERENGEFVHYQTFPRGQARDPEHPDFAGQAIAALMLVHKVDPQPRWLGCAQRAAKHLITVRDKGVPIAKLPGDHWLLRGLAHLHRHADDGGPLLDHAGRLTQALAMNQHRAPAYTDWLGGYYSPPGAMTAANRTGALLAGYRLLRDKGGDHRTNAIAALDAAIAGMAFQLQCQFRPENAMYYKDPHRVLGAFRESLTSPAVRIDFVSQNLTALLDLYRLMEEEKIAGFAVPKPQRPEDAGPGPASPK